MARIRRFAPFRSTLSLTTALVGGLALLASPAHAQNLPTLANAGGATVSTASTTMTVNLNNASRILSFNSYDVGAGYGVNYVTANTSTPYAVLNRVTGGQSSNISGAIASQPNIEVWLSNPNGILFSSTGSFNGGSLVLTTLDVTDADFLDGGSFNLSGISSAALSFAPGSSLTSSGNIIAVAQQADAGGSMSAAGSLALVAARNVAFTTGVGSPLALQINSGTTLPGIHVSGTGSITAGTVGLVAASNGTVMNAVLGIDSGAALQATAVNGAVVLATADYSSAGRSIALPDNAFDAIVSNGSLVATGTGGGVVVRAAGNATVDSAAAVGDVSLAAAQVTAGALTSSAGAVQVAASTGTASVTGNVIAGNGDFSVSGTGVALGNGATAVTQKATGTVSVTSTNGNITGGSGLTLQSNSDGIGTEALILDASGGPIILDNVRLQGGPARQSDLLIRFGTPGFMVRTGDVSARSIGNTDAAHATATGNFVTQGDVTMGNLSLVNPLDMQTTAGGLNLGGIVVTAAGGATLQAPSGHVIVTGDVSVPGNYVVSGSRVSLGVDPEAETQSAAGGISITAGTGGFTGGIGLTLRSDSDGSGGEGIALMGNSVTVDGRLIAPVLTATASFSPLSLTGANQIAQVDGLSASSSISFTNTTALRINGAVSTASNVTIRNSGDLTLTGNGRVSGALVQLSTGGDFVNQRGSDAINASNRWLVYAADPSGNNYGSLDSGNVAIWNGTIDTVAPASTSGSRYVFAYQPTLTVSSTDLSKVYGTDLTGALNGNYSVSVLQAGVSGAYLGDTLASVLSGTPAITSSGAAANADVSGGPYVMTVNQGSLAVGSRYALLLSNAGRLTVTPKPINGTLNASSKTYDGTTAGTGSVALSGVLAGDDVTTAGAAFAFADKNVGTGKTVTVSGTTLTGADAGNYTLTVPATALADILAKALTGTISVDSKTYDGTTAATGSVALSGLVSGEDVATTGSTFAFADKNVGAGKTVAVSGTVLTGTDAGNYTLSIPASALGSILAKALTATVTANDKTYDGTTAATASVGLTGVVAGDNVGTTGSFAFADKNAGAAKTVNVSALTLTGADAGNYTLTVPASVVAAIFQKAIAGTASANDKTYDGTTAATGSVSLAGVAAGDSVSATGTAFTFADKNVGAAKTVTVSGTTLTGADAGNYTVTVNATTLADILAKAITATATADSKTYDGTTNATGVIALNGVIAGDAVGTSGTSFTFADKNAGKGKAVTVAGTTLTGADAGNYTMAVDTSALADILPKAITGVATADDKTYDGTTVGTGRVVLTGLVADDTVGTTGTSFTFADRNAGAKKTVAVSGTALNGADAGNYTLTINGSTLADILQRALTLAANNAEKVERRTDPQLGYALRAGSLVTGDAFTGALARDPGEAPGSYAITLGSLSAGSNYKLTFIPGTFSIVAAPEPESPALPAAGAVPSLRSLPLPSQLASMGQSQPAITIAENALCTNERDCAPR